MTAYEEGQIEFSILGLVRDPLPDLREQLAINVRSLEIINERLTNRGPNDKVDLGTGTVSLEALQETVLGPEGSLGLTRAMIDEAVVPKEFSEEQSLSSLARSQEELRKAQIEVRGRVREEQQAQDADQEHATGRRYDYGPAVRGWLRCLARKEQLKKMLGED